MEGEDHGTTVLLSTYHGLRFINADWDTSGLVRHRDLRRSRRPFRPAVRATRFRDPTTRGDGQSHGLPSARRGPGQTKPSRSSSTTSVSTPNRRTAYDSLGEALEREGKLPGAMLNYRRACSGPKPTTIAFCRFSARISSAWRPSCSRGPPGPVGSSRHRRARGRTVPSAADARVRSRGRARDGILLREARRDPWNSPP